MDTSIKWYVLAIAFSAASIAATVKGDRVRKKELRAVETWTAAVEDKDNAEEANSPR